MRFGYSFIIGIIPFAGDLANGVLGYKLVIKPAKDCEYAPVVLFTTVSALF